MSWVREDENYGGQPSLSLASFGFQVSLSKEIIIPITHWETFIQIWGIGNGIGPNNGHPTLGACFHCLLRPNNQLAC